MNELWPWMLLAGLGAFHGLNPAMGWLFAVALGVHRQSSAAVVKAVPAIALGHAVSIALVAGAVVAVGLFVDQGAVRIATGLGATSRSALSSCGSSMGGTGGGFFRDLTMPVTTAGGAAVPVLYTFQVT